jgi:pyridoxal 5'-phosphate synthase pdxT subunit
MVHSVAKDHQRTLRIVKQSMETTVGVLALQGAFLEHLTLLRKAADFIANLRNEEIAGSFDFIEVRTPQQLSICDALIIPGGESTTISLVAADSGLLEPLRDFVKYDSRPEHLIFTDPHPEFTGS